MLQSLWMLSPFRVCLVLSILCNVSSFLSSWYGVWVKVLVQVVCIPNIPELLKKKKPVEVCVLVRQVAACKQRSSKSARGSSVDQRLKSNGQRQDGHGLQLFKYLLFAVLHTKCFFFLDSTNIHLNYFTCNLLFFFFFKRMMILILIRNQHLFHFFVAIKSKKKKKSFLEGSDLNVKKYTAMQSKI